MAYWEHETVFKLWKLFVTLLAAVHAILLVHHLLIAVLARTGLIETVLFAHIHDGADTGEIIGLENERIQRQTSNIDTDTCQKTFLMVAWEQHDRLVHNISTWRFKTEDIYGTAVINESVKMQGDLYTWNVNLDGTWVWKRTTLWCSSHKIIVKVISCFCKF